VPFLISWPGKIPAGQVYPHPVSSLDVAATAVALAGIEAPAGELDGINLMPYLTGKVADVPARKLYWRWTTQAAIRDGDWKYLRGGSREYLFNLRDDMGEKHNLMKLQPQIAQRLKTDLETWSQALIPAGLDKRDLKEGTNRYFDHYLDGKQVSVPAAKAPENAPKTEKPRKKKRQPKASPPAPQP